MSDRLIDRLKLFERYSTELSKILNSINIGDDLAQDPLVDNLPHNRHLLPEEIIPVNNGLFRLASWNCCGVLSSLDFLCTSLPGNGIGVMGLCETFLKKNTLNAANIQGYQILQKNILNNQKGGLAFYIHTSLHFKEIKDFYSLYEEMLFEFLVIEVTIASEKVLLCMFYSPPSSSTKKYLDKFAKMVISKKRKSFSWQTLTLTLLQQVMTQVLLRLRVLLLQTSVLHPWLLALFRPSGFQLGLQIKMHQLLIINL